MCVVHVRRDWCTRHCTVREGATYGRRKFGEEKYYFAFSSRSFWLADAEEANKVIIIAPISESDTLLIAVSH